MGYFNLPTGKTIYISTYNLLFKTVDGKVVPVTDEEIAEFMQQCIADDLGEIIENPFTRMSSLSKLTIEEDDEYIPDEAEEKNIDLDSDFD